MPRWPCMGGACQPSPSRAIKGADGGHGRYARSSLFATGGNTVGSRQQKGHCVGAALQALPQARRSRHPFALRPDAERLSWRGGSGSMRGRSRASNPSDGVGPPRSPKGKGAGEQSPMGSRVGCGRTPEGRTVHRGRRDDRRASLELAVASGPRAVVGAFAADATGVVLRLRKPPPQRAPSSRSRRGCRGCFRRSRPTVVRRAGVRACRVRVTSRRADCDRRRRHGSTGRRRTAVPSARCSAKAGRRISPCPIIIAERRREPGATSSRRFESYGANTPATGRSFGVRRSRVPRRTCQAISRRRLGTWWRSRRIGTYALFATVGDGPPRQRPPSGSSRKKRRSSGPRKEAALSKDGIRGRRSESALRRSGAMARPRSAAVRSGARQGRRGERRCTTPRGSRATRLPTAVRPLSTRRCLVG